MFKPRGRKNLPKILLSFGRHLVYAEGTKTEPFYVEDLKLLVSEKLKVGIRDIEIVPTRTSKSKHTCELVDFAEKNVLERIRKGEVINYVWIFYDNDGYQDFDETYLKIKELNDKYDGDINWMACWSNECFEVWIYHYFEKLTTALPKEEYIDRINKFLKRNRCKEEYSKTRTDLHHFLTANGGNIEKAMKWMKEADNGRDKKPNPSSGIYQFAEYIMVYINKETEGGNE